MNGSHSILLHLGEEYTEPIRDPLWKNIYLSSALKRIAGTEPFQNLARIKQLGPAYLVYPGATHTRLGHSLGVFHTAKRLIEAIVSSHGCRDLSIEGVKAFLCASLLHDLGHFPYAHSLKELPLKEHEALTAEAILSTRIERLIRDELGTDPAFVAAIVDTCRPANVVGASDTHTPPGLPDELLFYRNLLSGVLDPDKLDYLTRDAFFCGVPYGIQDIDFIIDRIRPFSSTGTAIQVSGIPAIENILFSKYLMYRTVYWHKTVRVATAMIKKAVILGLREGIIQPESLYGKTDDEFMNAFDDHDFPPFSMVPLVRDRNLFKIVLELPFGSGENVRTPLLGLEARIETEARIAYMIARRTGVPVMPHEVIIDIPEPISFEIDLPILDEDGSVSFIDSGSVFTPRVMEDFTRNLRKIRVMVPPAAATELRNREEIVEWLG